MEAVEFIKDAPDKAFSLGKKYVKKTEAYYKLKLFKQIALSISTIIKIIVIGGVLFVGFIFFTIFAVLILGKLLNSYEYACLSIALFHFILAFIAYKKRYLIENRVIKTVSKTFFE